MTEIYCSARKLKSELLPLNAEIPKAIIRYENESLKEISTRLKIDIEEAVKVKRVVI
jgi:hypothetical protein